MSIIVLIFVWSFLKDLSPYEWAGVSPRVIYKCFKNALLAVFVAFVGFFLLSLLLYLSGITLGGLLAPLAEPAAELVGSGS